MGEDAEKKQYPNYNYASIKRTTDNAKKPEKEKKNDIPAKRKARVTKRTVGERIVDNFMSIDKEEIREHLIFDWLFPEIISMIESFLRSVLSNNGKPMVFTKSKRERDGRTYTAYDAISSIKRQEKDKAMPTRQDFRRIRLTFYERDDAMGVRDDMMEDLAQSSGQFVTVKDLFSHPMVELPTDSTMYKWGWYDLEDAIVTRYGDDWVLEMPKAVPISGLNQ